MVSRRRAAALTFVGTGGNTILVMVQAVVLIPLYLRAIGPSLYGAWLATGDILIWLQAFDLGLPNLIIQRIGNAHARRDRKTLAEYFATGLTVLGVLGVVFAASAIAAAPALAQLVRVAPADAGAFITSFRIAGVATAVLLVNNAVVGYSRGIQNVALLSSATLVGSATGLTISLVGILSGFGLLAIAFGIVARVIVVVGASAVLVAQTYSEHLRGHFLPRMAIVRELSKLLPATAAAGLSYSLTNQSDNFLIALMLRPDAVPVFNLTKKASETARGILDTVANASYGAFAHLVGSADSGRAREIYTEIKATRLALAVAAAAAYIAVNRSLMSVWVGDQFFGGAMLTVLLALQLIFGGQAYLANYLYRATGQITHGSVALTVEGVARITLVAALLKLIGINGVPLAAIATAVPAFVLYDRWLKRRLPANEVTRAPWFLLSTATAGSLAAAIVIAQYIYRPSWSYVVGAGIIIGSAVMLLMIAANPELLTIRELGRRMRGRAAAATWRSSR